MVLLSRSLIRRQVAGIAAFCVLFSACLASQAGRLTNPGPDDRHVALEVTSLLVRHHLRQHPLDDEMSERCLKTFLKDLDPMKMYFYQCDFDEFAKSKDDLANLIQKGDVSFAYTVFNTLPRPHRRAGEDDRRDAEPEAGFHASTRRWSSTRTPSSMPRPRRRPTTAGGSGSSTTCWCWKLKRPTPRPTRRPTRRRPWRRQNARTAARAALPQLRQADAPDRQRRVAGNVPDGLTTAFDPHTDYMSPTSLENFNIRCG